jgi:hypothetical protein
VARVEPRVNVGGLLEVGQMPKCKIKAFLGNKACTRKATAGRKHNMHTCKESSNCKEEKNTRMRGRSNDGRFRVLVRYCNG